MKQGIDYEIVQTPKPAYEIVSVGELPQPSVSAPKGDVASWRDEEFPEDLRDQASKMRNAYFYARNLGISAADAYDYESEINGVLYGPGTDSAAAWTKTRNKIFGARRKTLGEALEHGYANANLQAAHALTGIGRQIAEVKGLQASILDPAFRWMFHLPKDLNLDQFLRDMATAAQDDVTTAREEHPEYGYAIDPDAGYAEALWQSVSRPENLLQGLIENVPMILEGALGKMLLGPVGLRAGIGIPLSGQVYQEARAEGTEPLSAFAQSIATGGIEAEIEAWTLGRKIGLAKNFRNLIQKTPGRRILWEGTKAFFRGTAEEGSQQFNANFWNWLFTDRSQKLLAGVQQAMALGGPLEMVMSGAFAGAGATGAHVNAQDAQERLEILRRSVWSAPVTVEQKVEMLAEIEEAQTLIDEWEAEEKGTIEENVPGEEGHETAIETAVPAEGAAVVAPPAAPVAGGPAAAEKAGDITEEVVPNLYIGNVTARMKGVYAEELGAKASEIGPYTEKGWPTKRTQVPLTRAEAQEYLTWLETDLQRRLDENLITTYPAMAQANADWGDLKELRRVLGIQTQLEGTIAEARRARTRLRKLLRTIEKLAAAKKVNVEKAAATIDELRAAITEKEQIITSAGRPWRIVQAGEIETEYQVKSGTKVVTLSETGEIIATGAERVPAGERVIPRKQATVVRDQGEWETAEAEIKRLRQELLAAKTETEIQEIESAILAQEQHILDLARTLKRAVTVLRDTKASVYGAIQPSRLQESKMTVQEVLRATLKRAAHYAEAGYKAGRKELRAQLAVRERARKRLNKALKIIRAKTPQTVDVVYRQSIAALKADMDLAFRSPDTLAKRKSLEEYLQRHPERIPDISTKLLTLIGTKPLNDYTIEELEAVANNILVLKHLGGLRRKFEVAQYRRQQDADLAELQKGSVPMTEREMIRAPHIGETLSWEDRARNTLARLLNVAAQKWRSATTSMDVLFDLLDGGRAKYEGPNYRTFKATLDKDWGRYEDLCDTLMSPIIEKARALNLQEGNFERIGVYAALQQEGGRKKLQDSGYTDEQIDEVHLTPEELQLYQLMRQHLDELAPEIAEVMEVVYNQPFETVRNYFSFMTDFEAMSEFEIRQRFGDQVPELSQRLRKDVERGFAMSRTGGFQKIKLNALQVYLQHVDNAAYLLTMGADIKRLGDLAARAEYAQAAGAIGQAEALSWIDLMARKGKAQAGKTIPILDILRKHTGAAMIGFRASTALVNATPLLDGAGLIGSYAFRGVANITDARWRAFILDNFPEIRHRFGGDIEFMEFGKTAIEKIEQAGFWPLRQIDGLTASAIASGAYQKYLDEHQMTLNLEEANADAVAYAQLIVRRSQASGFYKDLPSTFTRGTFTGNRSLDRLMVQFQTFILNRWSLIEHDMLRAGIRTGNQAQAINLFVWLALAGIAEMTLRRASKELIALITGEDLDDWPETFGKEYILNTLQNVPFVSQGVALYQYGQIPVPSLSLAQRITEQMQTLKQTKNPDRKKIRALELLITAGGTAAGLPGTMQVAEILRSATKPEKKEKLRFE